MLANEDWGRQAGRDDPLSLLIHLEKEKGNLSWIPVLLARDCTVLASAPRQSKSSQSWTEESSGCKTSAVGRQEQEQRQEAGSSSQGESQRQILCWLETNEPNWALRGLSPGESKKGLNVSFCPTAEQRQHAQLAHLSQDKKASQGASSDSWVRKSERAFVPQTPIHPSSDRKPLASRPV